MTATYPFTNPNGGVGYASGQRLPSAHVNTIWEQSAAAADGSVFTDLALAKNWSSGLQIDASNTVALLLWDPGQRKWWGFGRDGSNNPLAYSSIGGRYWSAASVPASDGFAVSSNRYAAASNGAGTIVFGGQPAVASTNKIRESPDGGVTWSARSIGAADTVGVNSISWVSPLFFAGLAAQANNMYTSVDGITWTQRTTPNSDARGQIASNGTIVVVGNATAATPRVITTTDAIVWTERTMPSSAQWNHVVWVSQLSKFIAVSFTGAVAASSDGITWSSAGLSSISATNITNVASYGRVVVAVGANSAINPILWTSVDGGVSWVRQYAFSGTSGSVCVAYGSKQLMFADGANPTNQYLGWAAGT